MINLYTIAKLKFYEIFSRLIKKYIWKCYYLSETFESGAQKNANFMVWFYEYSGKQDQDRQVECANVHVTYLCILIKE